MVNDEKLVALIDGRCGCKRCEASTSNVYRMVGWCMNCKGGSFLILYRSGDSIRDLDCPLCNVYYSVPRSTQRRATDDEIPAAVGVLA